MTRFYLHIHNAHGEAEDDEGLDLPSLAEAQEQAITGIRSLLSAEVRNGTMNLNGWIDIRDENGSVLVKVPFADAVRIEGAEPAAKAERTRR